jgi:hypothetical protein
VEETKPAVEDTKPVVAEIQPIVENDDWNDKPIELVVLFTLSLDLVSSSIESISATTGTISSSNGGGGGTSLSMNCFV